MGSPLYKALHIAIIHIVHTSHCILMDFLDCILTSHFEFIM